MATPISVLCTNDPSSTALATSAYRIASADHVSNVLVRPTMKPQKNTITSEHVRITRGPNDVRSRVYMICACVVLDNHMMLPTKHAATKHTFSRFAPTHSGLHRERSSQITAWVYQYTQMRHLGQRNQPL
jgi:hypothetical protein